MISGPSALLVDDGSTSSHRVSTALSVKIKRKLKDKSERTDFGLYSGM
jgi:hypothetical protein